MLVVVNNLMISYERHGTHTNTILLLHGWGDSMTSFRPIMHILSNKYTCVAVDLPGFGGSQRGDDNYTLELFAKFVRDFCNKIGIQPVSIIGHSNGGAITTVIAAKEMLDIDNIVLLASSGVREKSTKKTVLAVAAKAIGQLLRLLPSKTRANITRRAYTKLNSDQYSAENMQVSFRNIISQDTTELAKKVSVPTLLVYGDQDLQTPVRYGHKLHTAISSSQLEILQGAGHFLHIDQAEQVASLITKFYES